MSSLKKATLVAISVLLLGLAATPTATRAQDAPVFVITTADSSVKFSVKASVALEGTFEKWNATLKLHVSGRHDGSFGHQDSSDHL